MSASEIFVQSCVSFGQPVPVMEYQFHPKRKWRFDFAWPEHRVALEVEGGIWTGGAHGRGTGITRDIEKYNEAGAMGWVVIRCVPKDLLKVKTMDYIHDAISNR